MKTTILTIATLIATVFGFNQPAAAASGNDEEVSTVLTGVTNISKIEVHGNVELYLSAGTADQVKIYNHYYAESALAQEENGVLRITSYSAQKLVVWVTVSDLSNLSLYDNAEVKSFGKFSAIGLDVQLYDRAYAKLNLDTYAAVIHLSDRANADLSGSVTEADFKIERSAFLNLTGLAAVHLTKKVTFSSMFRHNHSEWASL
jgi:hypothetical protein